MHILDGFYKDPDRVRAHALLMPFDCRGPFPGVRTMPLECQNVRTRLEGLIGDPITFWPVIYDTGAFQMTCDDDSNKLFVHADPTWIGLVYLTPNPPAGTGTSFYQHRSTRAAVRPVSDEIDAMCTADGAKPECWTERLSVENTYDRMIAFRGHYYHRPTAFFGKTAENGRLFQTFFFCGMRFGDCSSTQQLEEKVRSGR